MRRITLTHILLLLLILAGVAWAAGTVTDYVTLTPAAAPGAADEGTIYYDSDDDQFVMMDDAAAWHYIGPEVISVKGQALAPAIATDEGDIYYNTTTHKLMWKDNVGWKKLSGVDMDDAYNYGSAITHDTGAIAITSAMVDGTDVLTITRDGAAGTGQLIQLTDTQTGSHPSMVITHTAGHAGSGGLLIEDSLNNTTALAYLLALYSNDDAQVVTDGIYFKVGTANMMTDAIDASDAEITNAINVGANTIIGTTAVIDLDLFTMDAAGDVAFLETGGSSADPDFQVAGWCLLGSGNGGALGTNGNSVYWDNAGQIFFEGTAQPTLSEYIYMDRSDLAIAGGDGTAPSAAEADGADHWYYWAYTEAVDVSYHTWRLPAQIDVSEDINVYIHWNSGDAGGDGCTWTLTYCAIADDSDETSCDPTVALNTPLVEDTTDAQWEWAMTPAGVIDGGTLTDEDTVKLKLTCTASRDTDTCNVDFIKIEYRQEHL